MSTETFTTTLAAVLTHTTGILVGSLDDAWPLQDFVVGADLMTHERVGTSMNITDRLLAQFPALAEAHPPKITTQDQADAWVRAVAEHTGLPLIVEVTR